jgi:ABC-2 type transport system permease protein
MATIAARRRPLAWPSPRSRFGALVRRAARDARTRTLAFIYLFVAVSYINPVSYRHTYPTLADRVGFARSFAHNKAVVLFYGKAYDVLTVGGYTAWRSGGVLAIFAAVFGLLAAVRAWRAEEDAGRAEIVLSAGAGRRTAFGASLTAIGLSTIALWAAALAGLLLARLPAGNSAYLALAIVSVIPVFVGVGGLVSQLAPSRRVALELGGSVVAACFLLRVIADTSTGAGWLRWATPLGWAEELRPFTGAQPLVLLLPALTAITLLLLTWRLAAVRDVGNGLLTVHDSSRPRLALLTSTTAQALRSEQATLIVWAASVTAFALVVGIISKSISSAGISNQLVKELAKLGVGSVLHPAGYIAFSFTFFAVAISLFTVSQVVAAWHEESAQQLETLIALPVGRDRWLGGRLALAGGAALVIALAAGLAAWLGAVSQGVSLSLPKMLLAGLNCLPVSLLFLGVTAAIYALVPRATAPLGYGLLVVMYLWQLFGSLLGAPHWLVEATPFAHVAAVPTEPFQPIAAAVMIAVGLVAAVAATWCFRRRDLVIA